MRAACYVRNQTRTRDQPPTGSRSSGKKRTRSLREKHGWTVDPAHIFTDDGISGASS